jgi:hypothetical protein
MGELLSKLLGIIEEDEEEKTPSPTSGSGNRDEDEMVSKMVSGITELKELADTNPDEKKCTTGGGLYKNDEKLKLKKVDNSKISFTVPKGVTNAKLPEGCSMSFSYLNKEDDEFVDKIYKERENTIELPKDYDGGITASLHETKIIEALDKFNKIVQENRDGSYNQDNVHKKFYDEIVQKGYIDSASSGSDEEKLEKFLEKIHIKLGVREWAIENVYITLPDSKKRVKVIVKHDGTFRLNKDALIAKIKEKFGKGLGLGNLEKVNDGDVFFFDVNKNGELSRVKESVETAYATNMDAEPLAQKEGSLYIERPDGTVMEKFSDGSVRVSIEDPSK